MSSSKLAAIPERVSVVFEAAEIIELLSHRIEFIECSLDENRRTADHSATNSMSHDSRSTGLSVI